jgi:hypothetical protein
MVLIWDGAATRVKKAHAAATLAKRDARDCATELVRIECLLSDLQRKISPGEKKIAGGLQHSMEQMANHLLKTRKHLENFKVHLGKLK